MRIGIKAIVGIVLGGVGVSLFVCGKGKQEEEEEEKAGEG
jgi:hypothetical protein